MRCVAVEQLPSELCHLGDSSTGEMLRAVRITDAGAEGAARADAVGNGAEVALVPGQLARSLLLWETSASACRWVSSCRSEAPSRIER